jgi:hypothetical protein
VNEATEPAADTAATGAGGSTGGAAGDGVADAVERLMRSARFFFPGRPSADGRVLYREGGRGADEFYRERWRHDREVRSTHGVANCSAICVKTCKNMLE